MKTTNYLKLLTLLTCCSLWSCVEGRNFSKSSVLNSDSKEVNSEENLQAIEDEMYVAFQGQNFKEITDQLTILFKKSFTLPMHIFSKAECPATLISPAEFTKYNTYYSHLINVDIKYDRAIASEVKKLDKESSAQKRDVFQSVIDNLGEEQDNIHIRQEDCRSAIDDYIANK